MSPFDENATCSKCGGADIYTDYCEKGWHPSFDHTDFRGWKPASMNIELRNAHIHRHCRRCHYGWAELPLDAVTTAEGAPS